MVVAYPPIKLVASKIAWWKLNIVTEIRILTCELTN